MSPIEKITRDALALPSNLKVELVEKLIASLEFNIDEQT